MRVNSGRALFAGCVLWSSLCAPAWSQVPVFSQQPTTIPHQVGDFFPLVGFAGIDGVTYQWQKDGVDLPGETRNGLYFLEAKATDTGVYRVRATNSSGSTYSNSVTVTIPHPNATLRFTRDLASGIANQGGSVTFSTDAVASLPFQWMWMFEFDSFDTDYVYLGTQKTNTLTLSNVGTKYFHSGVVTVRATTGTYPNDDFREISQTTFLSVIPTGGTLSRLTGNAVRSETGPGSEVVTAGWVVQGTGTCRVLVRGLGPTLGVTIPANVPLVADPVLEIFDTSGRLIARSDDWATDATAAAQLVAAQTEIGLVPFPAGSKDSAVLLDLPPGGYTAQLLDRNGGRGVGLIEVYEASPPSPTVRIAGLASRARITSHGNYLNQGLLITGSTPRRLLIRALGPKLAEYGITDYLPDPAIRILKRTATGWAESFSYPVVSSAPHSNDNWMGAAPNWLNPTVIDDLSRRIGLSRLKRPSLDAAVDTVLDPGLYSILVENGTSAPGNGTGVVLLEIYEAP